MTLSRTVPEGGASPAPRLLDSGRSHPLSLLHTPGPGPHSLGLPWPCTGAAREGTQPGPLRQQPPPSSCVRAPTTRVGPVGQQAGPSAVSTPQGRVTQPACGGAVRSAFQGLGQRASGRSFRLIRRLKPRAAKRSWQVLSHRRERLRSGVSPFPPGRPRALRPSCLFAACPVPDHVSGCPVHGVLGRFL